MAKNEEEVMFEEAQNSLNDLYNEEFEEEAVMPDDDSGDTGGDSTDNVEKHNTEEKEEDEEKENDKKQKDEEKNKEENKHEEDRRKEEEQKEEEKKQEKKREEEKKSHSGITKSPKKMLAVLGGMVVGVFSLIRQAIRALLFGPTYAVRTENELGRKVDAIKDMEAKEHANKEAEKGARDRNVPERKKDSQESEKNKPEASEPKKPVMEELKDKEQGMPTLEEQADIRIDIPFEDEPEQNNAEDIKQEDLPENNENAEDLQEEESKNIEEENEEKDEDEKHFDKNEEKEKNNGFVDKMTKQDIQKLFKTPESEKALKTFKDSLGVSIKLSDDAKTLTLSKDGKTSRAVSATAFLKGDVRELSVACKDIGLAKKDFQYRNCDTKYIVMAASMCAKFRKDNLEAGNFVRSDGAVKNVRNKETLAYCSFAGDRGVYKIDISKSGKNYTASIGNQKSGEKQTGEMVFNDRHFKDFTKDAIKRERQVSHESFLDSFVKKHQFLHHEKETGRDTEEKETGSPKQEHTEKLSKDEKDMALSMAKKCRKASDSLLWTDGAGHEAAAMKEALGRSHEDAMEDLEDIAKKIDSLAQKGYSDGLTCEENKELHHLIDRAAAQVTAAEYAVQHARGANETVLQPGDIAVLEDIVNKCGPEDAALYAKASNLLENPTQYMTACNKQQLSDIYKEAEEKGFIGSNREEKKETENHINHDEDNKKDLEEEDVIDVECKDLDEESGSPGNDKDEQEETDNDIEEKDEQTQNVEEEDISL